MSAGPFRIATELRQFGFSTQVIDISFILSVKHLMLILKKFIGNDTLWVGVSNTFLNKFCGVAWPTMNNLHDEQIRQVMQDFKSNVNQLNQNTKLIYGNAGWRIDLTDLGYYKFEGFTDSEIVKFTQSCLDKDSLPSRYIYKKEYDNFTQSKITWLKNDLVNDQRAVPIEISRGCIFRCSFCRYPLNGKQKFDYIKEPETLYEELLYNWEQFGITDYIFTDDTLNDSIYKLEKIKTVIDRLPFKINFVSYVRLDLLMRFPAMISLLAEMGLSSCTIGLETMDKDNAKVIGKGVDFYKQIEFLHRIRQKEWQDISVISGFIIGLPYDTDKKLQDLTDFLYSDNNPLTNWEVATLNIYPADQYNMVYNSEIDKDYKKFGYEFSIDSQTNKRYWYNNVSNLDERELQKIKQEIYNRRKSVARYASFETMDLLNLGVDRQDIKDLTIENLNQKYNIPKLIDENYKNYLKNLMKLSN